MKHLYGKGETSLSFDQLNQYLQNLNQPRLTYDLLSLMYDQDTKLQSIIISMTPDKIELGKKTDDAALSGKTKIPPPNPAAAQIPPPNPTV